MDQVEMTHDAMDEEWRDGRTAMVRTLRDRYGVSDERVLAAMGRVRRHVFLPEEERNRCGPYGDHPCDIGFGQTISQPYIVAHMTEFLHVVPGGRILDVGAGSGYQSAVLAELGAEVFAIEKVPELARRAQTTLQEEGYDTVRVLPGDGYDGCVECSPFDGILVGCAPGHVPESLVAQLGDGGRMILPVGSAVQQLFKVTRTGNDVHEESDIMVRFVPMI